MKTEEGNEKRERERKRAEERGRERKMKRVRDTLPGTRRRSRTRTS